MQQQQQQQQQLGAGGYMARLLLYAACRLQQSGNAGCCKQLHCL
jgi:hypothetical protein